MPSLNSSELETSAASEKLRNVESGLRKVWNKLTGMSDNILESTENSSEVGDKSSVLRPIHKLS